MGSLTLATAGPAAADQLCQTTENAPLYSGVGGEGGTGYLFTLSGGRGFRAIDALYSDNYNRYWVYGHGAEHPDRDGFVLMGHTDCCPTC